MLIVQDKGVYLELCRKAQIPQNVIQELERSFARIFQDGNEALQKNVLANEAHFKKLRECFDCLEGNTISRFGAFCLDGDTLARYFDKEAYPKRRPSVDMIVLTFKDGSSIQAQFVEAKLGAAVKETNPRPRHPSPTDLYEKYDWTKERLVGVVEVAPEMHLLVSKNVLQKMRNRFANYNRANHSRPIVCECCADYLCGLGCDCNTESCLEVSIA